MNKKKIIGFSLDYETTESYSKLPWYAIRENSLTAVSDLGAVALPLAHDLAAIDDYFEMCDGLVITGGNFDVPPEYYGEKTASDTVMTKEKRSKFEFGITQKFIDAKKPLLGICGGQQVLNVAFGGSLVQHIPDEYDTQIEHEQPNPRHEPGHNVTIEEGSLLHKIVGSAEIPVNSAHHQSVKQVGDGLIVNATAPDGVIEGIEAKPELHPFCLGVQWHPEYHVSPADAKIFRAFLDAC